MTFLIIFVAFVVVAVCTAWVLIRTMDRRHRHTSAVREHEEVRVLAEMETRLDAVRSRSRGRTESLYRELERIRRGAPDAS